MALIRLRVETVAQVGELGSAELGRPLLDGPRVRVLNLGGFANPDVLRLQLASGGSLVVKDYAPRSALIRLLAPFLVRRERDMLERLADLPGIPALGPQLDSLAFAMEWIDGQPLRGRSDRRALPPSFFAGLERILEGLAERGVIYTDLRSPSNVLVTRSGAPALVDLSSAVRLRAPRVLVRWFERRALGKLRDRYESAAPRPARESYDGPLRLHTGSRRIRLWDSGPLGDAVPLLFLPDAGLGVEVASELMAVAQLAGRRVVALELPGFGGSSAPGFGRPRLLRMARELARTLGMLRLPRVDVLAHGWSGLVARCLAAAHRSRVRVLHTVGTPQEWLEEPFLSRWQAACAEPREALTSLRAQLAGHPQSDALGRALDALEPRRLARAYRALPVVWAMRSGWESPRLEGLPEPLCPTSAESAPALGARGGWRAQAEQQLARVRALAGD